MLNPSATIYAYIVNAQPWETNYDDNIDTLKLGGVRVTIDGTPPTCRNSSDGTLTVHASGGYPPYIYSWSNGSNDESISSSAGGYTVTVFDNVGNVGKATINVKQMPSDFYKIVIETPYNFLNRWIIIKK